MVVEELVVVEMVHYLVAFGCLKLCASCLVLLYCISTNYTQSLGHVDQLLHEDSEVLFREQGGYHKNGEYTYSGWRKIDIVLNLLLNLVLMLFYNLSMQNM